MILLIRGIYYVIGLMVICSAAIADTFNAGTTVQSGVDSITELITNVAPVVFSALAILIGWKFAVKLIKKLGKQV